MDFYSRTRRPQTIAYPESKKIKATFSLKIDKTTGKKELQKTGATNIYDKIQAAKDETLIYNILEKYNAGDNQALNKVKGVYGDFTNMPSTLAEAQQRLIDAENTFKSLPLEIRREFNMSTTEFLASIANGEFEKVAQKFNKAPAEQPITETQVQQPVQTPVEQGGIRYE